MANWKEKIKTLLIQYWHDTCPTGTTGASRASIIAMANEIANGIANVEHNNLMTEWQLLLDKHTAMLTQHQTMLTAHITTLGALQTLMLSIASEPTLTPPTKAAATAVGETLSGLTNGITGLDAQINLLKTEIDTLKSQIESYKG